MIHDKSTKESAILLFSVFIVGLCTIIYELLIGSVSSYFLGDSIKQFSLTIGLTMTAMGIGTFLSRLIKDRLIYWFIVVEIILGLVGGLSVPVLYLSYPIDDIYYPAMITFIMIIGTLIGLEIPLLTRVMEKHYTLKINISNVLSIDYLGALAATLIFPFFMLPVFGIFNSSLITGIVNILVGLLNFWWFKDILKIENKAKIKILTAFFFIVLSGLLISSNYLIKSWESNIYESRVLLSKQTKYQKLVLTKNKRDVRLYLDGNLQFSSIDEYRYHEPLVHIPVSLAPSKENVLVLGGGDGFVVRELLKYSDIKKITLVDLDSEMIKIAKKNNYLKKLNHNSFANPKVKIIQGDAFKFLENSDEYYDVIIADLPDPNNSAMTRLYSKEFYKLVKGVLSRTGIFVTQSTSPFFSKEAFWCIEKTVKESGFNNTYPYHVYVPSFGDWGFVMATNFKINPENIEITVPTKFLNNQTAKNLFNFEKDLATQNIKYSTLDKPEILNYYLNGWKYWN